MRRVYEGKIPVFKFKHTDNEYPKFLISDLIDIDIHDEELIDLVELIVLKETKKQYFTSDELSRLLAISAETITRIKAKGKFIQSKSEKSVNAKQTYKLYDVVRYLVEHRQYID
ncbi:MAG: hypothetical protein DRG78_15190 [Epsilonproteobacteria bacterium]|nr:MAG: hypothetical protein DRG78_15190 [Campylobacterota bacterium]